MCSSKQNEVPEFLPVSTFEVCCGDGVERMIFFLIKPYLYYEIRKMYKDTYEYRYGTTGYRDSCTTKHAKKPLEKAENTRRTLASVRSILIGKLRHRP